MARKKKTDYAVGYCKPPRQTQFQKGKSGNPGGRPRGSTSFAAALRKEGDRQITLTIDGKTRRVTKREASACRAWLEAMKGDYKALELVSKIDKEQPAQEADAFPEIEVTLVLEDGPPPHIRARQIEFANECPNFDPDRPESEWGPDDPDSDHSSD